MTSQQNRPAPPSKAAIAEYWGEPVQCFKCGHHRVERAHIVPWSVSPKRDPLAKATPDKFVLLCRRHHELAPDVGDPHYFMTWLDGWPEEDIAVFDAVRKHFESSRVSHHLHKFDSRQLSEAFKTAMSEIRSEVGFSTHGGRYSISTLAAVAELTLNRMETNLKEVDEK